MSRRFILAIACLLLLSGKAVAGWYHVENYVGFLGTDPIHLSLQTYDGFGSGLTVEGSYFYDAKRSPTAIYGKAIGTRLELCEIPDDKAFERIIVMGSKKPVDTSACPLSLNVDESGATGTWSKGVTQYPVTLKQVAMLDDTGEAKIEGIVEIPFWAHTKTHMFSGIYADGDAGMCMQKMQVIKKSSGKVIQEIDFKDDVCSAGMLMTPIFMNVEKYAEGGVDIISVNFSGGQIGHTVDYVFNRKTKTFRQKK